MSGLDGEDELKVGGLTLRGVTRGGILTCLMVPEFDVMFDVGGPVRGQLRFTNILVSHGHQDHLGGLPYLVSQRQLAGLPPAAVHVPVEIEDPLRRIFAAWSEIEGFALISGVVGHVPEDEVELARGTVARCVRSVHRVPSLTWMIERTTARLLPQYAELPPAELAELRRRGTPLTEPRTQIALAVTGDTTIDLFDRDPRLHGARVLVHEVTSFDDRRNVAETRAWGHTHVDELIAVSERFTGEALVVVHRSPRHTRAEAEAIVRARFPAGVRDRVHVFGR